MLQLNSEKIYLLLPLLKIKKLCISVFAYGHVVQVPLEARGIRSLEGEVTHNCVLPIVGAGN